MMTKARTILTLTGCLISGLSHAHFFSEAHDCKAPVKPLEFITELDKKEFEQDVEDYRSCLQAFVDKQNAAMAKHQTAAQKAADTWKDYAERELGLEPQKTN
ncbi:MAG: hypothetical protein V7752_08520 [Halopseudomonas sp.]